MYQDFVPWCQRSTVVRRSGAEMDAELEVGFKIFREKYMSHVHMEKPKLVKVLLRMRILIPKLECSCIACRTDICMWDCVIMQ